MIEYELPEPRFEELTLVNVDAVRGKGPGDSEVAPLKGRVLVDGPHGRKLTSEELAADREIRRFVDTALYEYYLVHLAVGFREHGSPKLKAAQVKLTLTSIPDMPAPFALDMKPLKEGDQVSVERTVRLGPKLKLLDAVDAEVGSVEAAKSFQRTELAVRGLGLDGPAPGWEFTRTASQKLDGSCRLELVVQAGRGAAVSVTGVVTAQAGGNIGWRYRGGLPGPLDFTAVI